MHLTSDDIEKLCSCTKAFMNHVHVIKQSFNLTPNKDHHGVCINYIDLQEYRDEFCTEMINTISEWIYSSTAAAKVIDQLISEGRTPMNAQAAFTTHTFQKFRNRDKRDLFAQGQIGELLLFNFLQCFFNAVPLLRKMVITTSSSMERYGADAIHYSSNGEKHLIFLGEAKTYSSEDTFNAAISKALDSILETYKNHRRELRLYVYDSFVHEDLVSIAQQYKNGTLQNVELHLVVIIVYSENAVIEKKSELQIKTDIIKSIEERGKKVNVKIFDKIDPSLLPRMNYILLPIWELESFVKQFQQLIGK